MARVSAFDRGAHTTQGSTLGTLTEGERTALKTLQGSTALVTGSSRGIGLAIAKELVGHGAHVMVNYLTHRDGAYRLSEEIRALGADAEVVQADVSDREQAKLLIDRTLERFGRLDILVNNAGIICDRSLKKMSFEEWDRVIQVDLNGVFNCTKMAVPGMIDRRSGAIVNISSIIGQTGAFGQCNYSAAKAGVIGLTKSCALELARYGITVNAICPGFIETDMLSAVPEDIRAALCQRIPLGRFGCPEEIAACVRFLVTEGRYITGQCVNVNGGLMM